MRTINFFELANISAKVENVSKAIKKASQFGKTLEGAKARLCHEWNNGYGDACKELGFAKPSEFNKFVDTLVGGELSKNLWTDVTIGRGKKAEEKHVPAIYVLKTKVDKTTFALDINGKKRYKFVKDETGKLVKENELKGIVTWTPDIMIKLVALHLFFAGELSQDIKATTIAKKEEEKAKKAEEKAKKAEEKKAEGKAIKKGSLKKAGEKKAEGKAKKGTSKKVAA